jgi:hypothetical protein
VSTLDGHRSRVDADGSHLVVREIVGPDVPAVPEPLFVGQPTYDHAEGLGRNHLPGGWIEERDVLRFGVECVTDETVGLGGSSDR